MKNKNFYQNNKIKDSSKRGYYQEKIDFFLNFLKENKDSKVLDLACNDGELTKKYTKYCNVVGVEINKEALKKCRERGLNCIYADVLNLPKKFENKFDVVLAGDIIEHVFETDEFLKQIKKVLKKNGVLLLTTPNVASIGRRLMLLFGRNPYLEYSTELPTKDFNVGHVRYYTHSDLRDQLIHNNFKEIEIYGDRVNLTSQIHIPHTYARKYPSLARNLMVIAKK